MHYGERGITVEEEAVQEHADQEHAAAGDRMMKIVM